MADIRIKDLATTASTTASDDFMAVDGTTNGTRKLSAATPSFATSVTVPGVSGPTATDLTLAGGSTGASLVLGQSASGVATFSSSITVNGGTANLNQTGTFFSLNFQQSGSPYASILAYSSSGELRTNIGPSAGWGGYQTWQTETSERMRLTNVGNLLIGTTTDITGTGGLHVAGTGTATSSSNGGALRVGTNVAMSGNAGGASYFGGNVNVGSGTAGYAAAGRATVSASGGSSALFGFSVGNATKGYALHTGTDLYLVNEAAGSTFIIGGNNITAITLSSTGAATFAGAVTTGGNLTLPAAPAASNRYILTGTNNTGTGQLTIQAGGGSTSWGGNLNLFETAHATKGGWVGVGLGVAGAKFTVNSAGFSESGEVASIDRTGAATFAGAVAIGNTVNTVSPTSPNRTVTMVIGGVTYYLAAKTTND